MGSEDGVMKIKMAEIDTRAPFRSVKEAVTLFGERVLAGELYANCRLKELHDQTNENGHNTSMLGTVTAELVETKQSLEKAKEESMAMANCLSSLKEELEHTKRELKHLKERESRKKVMEMTTTARMKENEESTKFVVKQQTSSAMDDGGIIEFQKKRYVTFANPPSVTHVVIPQGHEVLERHPSLRKKKKMPLIPFIGGIFSKKKASSEIA